MKLKNIILALTLCFSQLVLADDSKDDQKRVATPDFAREEGCDYIVVGRSITKSENPYETYNRIEAMMNK